jgi:hypothetical protein
LRRPEKLVPLDLRQVGRTHAGFLGHLAPLDFFRFPLAAHAAAGETAKTAKAGIWLPFLKAYRTMCLAPEPAFRRVLQEIRELQFGA